jgi:hypothetical protein
VQTKTRYAHTQSCFYKEFVTRTFAARQNGKLSLDEMKKHAETVIGGLGGSTSDSDSSHYTEL